MLKQTNLFDSWKLPNSNDHECVPKFGINFDVGDDELLCVAEQSERHASKEKENNFSLSVGAKEICTQVNIQGFDLEAGKSWHYPINFPERQYQLRIVEQALFRNTLVVLPTGLGKTFIAAVVMYNFYRWYPDGKIVFMAPTKPLVTQQIEACSKVMGIDSDCIIEMTGSMSPGDRLRLWHDEKRVFFLTPHILVNDLTMAPDIGKCIKCLVIDEAHKATGNYAYTQAVRIVKKATSDFRVLALSATPGSDLQTIQQVIDNLLIAHIEIRSEESPDVRPYCQNRKVESVIVKLSEEMKKYQNMLEMIVMRSVTRLQSMGCLYYREMSGLSKFLILQCREQFRKNPPKSVNTPRIRTSIENDFALSISLFHAYELLSQHGLRSVFFYLKDLLIGNKGFARLRTRLMCDDLFTTLFDELRRKYDDEINTSTQLRIKESLLSAHPKLKVLRDIVVEHFRKDPDCSNRSRVIVFSKFRESVHEITDVLNLEKPLVRPVSFVGQASANKRRKGITQKEQTDVLRYFAQGCYNTLIATCVAEEGLDIGDVDLIICFDTNRSPIRLIQRMGRTGRKRDGKIILLLTEGKEANSYTASDSARKRLGRFFQDMRKLQFYRANPRMIPLRLNPTCSKVTIQPQESGVLKKRSSERANKTLISDEELQFWKLCIRPLGKTCSNLHAALNQCSKWSGENSASQFTSSVGHSQNSRTYTHLLSSFKNIKKGNKSHILMTPDLDDTQDFDDFKRRSHAHGVTLDDWLINDRILPEISFVSDNELKNIDFLEESIQNCREAKIIKAPPDFSIFVNLGTVNVALETFDCVNFENLLNSFDLPKNFLKDTNLITPISDFDTIRSNEDFMVENLECNSRNANQETDLDTDNFNTLKSSEDCICVENSDDVLVDDANYSNQKHPCFKKEGTMFSQRNMTSLNQKLDFDIGDFTAIESNENFIFNSFSSESDHTTTLNESVESNKNMISSYPVRKVLTPDHDVSYTSEKENIEMVSSAEHVLPPLESASSHSGFVYQRSGSPVFFSQSIKHDALSNRQCSTAINGNMSNTNSLRSTYDSSFLDANKLYDPLLIVGSEDGISRNVHCAKQSNESEHSDQLKFEIFNDECFNSFFDESSRGNEPQAPSFPNSSAAFICSTVQPIPSICLNSSSHITADTVKPVLQLNTKSANGCEQTTLDFNLFESYDELFETFNNSHGSSRNQTANQPMGHGNFVPDFPSDSDDDFQVGSALRCPFEAKIQNETISKPKKVSRKNCSQATSVRNFILTQAEVSDADSRSTSSDETIVLSSADSFIDDGDDVNLDDSYVHQIYLESIKSPKVAVANRRLRPLTMDIFSQAPVPDSSYLLDSFCIEDEEENIPDVAVKEDVFSQVSISPRKTRRGTSLEVYPKKRRRRIMSSSESDY